MAGHRLDKEWYYLIERVETEWFSTRGRARRAEKEAIKREKPLYNVAYRRPIEHGFTYRLTVMAIDGASPRDKAYKLTDGGGLYLLVNPNGTKYWRFKYHFAGKEKLLSLGCYPRIRLTEARAKHGKAKRMVWAGADPSAVRRASPRYYRPPTCAEIEAAGVFS